MPLNPVERVLTAHARRRPSWRVPADQLEPTLDLPLARVPRYLADRVATTRALRGSENGKAWLPVEANRLIERHLGAEDTVLEFGSGSSTAWLAGLAGNVVSIEVDPAWHTLVLKRLADERLDNTDVRLVADQHPDEPYGAEHREACLDAVADLAPGSLGLVLVDGPHRDACAHKGLELLAPGGLLVIDNVNLFLPSPSRSPWKVDRPASQSWAELADEVADWPHRWVTNGVWDCAFWQKPGSDRRAPWGR